MKPQEAVDAISSVKIVDSGSTVSTTSRDPVIYPWVKVEFQGKQLKLSGAWSMKAVMKKVRASVCPTAGPRNRDVKAALSVLMGLVQAERDKVVARDAPALSIRHGQAVLTRTKRLEANKRREAVAQLRSLLRGILADATEEELADIWRDARAADVLES